MKCSIKLALLAGTLVLGACAGKQGWKVDGTVSGANGGKMAIEQNIGGSWLVLDSIEITSDGKFEFMADSAAAYPDLYRLTYQGRTIYFPVDSLDHVTISTSADDFGGRYNMGGSLSASKIAKADSLIYSAISEQGIDKALADSTLKLNLYNMLMADSEVMTAYYLISRNFNGKPLYNVSQSKLDYNMLRAIATKFQQLRPDDPRTKFLESRVTAEMKRRNPRAYEQEVEAALISLPADIVAIDYNGKEQTLSEVIGHGHPTLLSFAQYSAENSPAYAMALQTIYDKYRDRGLEIYQISIDGSEPEWRRLAQNLPWISVWLPTVKQGNPMVSYNVNVAPLTYVFDSEGNLTERVDDWQQLEKALARYF